MFSKYVDYGFTAGLEEQLDDITSGKEEWIKVLDNFWRDFNTNVLNVKEKRTREVLDLLNESLGALIFESDENGSINRKFSQMEMERAAKAIGLAQNSNALRSRLIAAGYDESVVNKLLGATGFRTKAAFEDKSQNVNRTKHGDHIFNTAGNKDLNVLWPERNKKYGGGAGGGAGGPLALP